jgi:membrane protein insertase Oxa1/YidC/SpoIIIJ
MLHFLHDLLVLPLMQLYATLFDVPAFWLSVGGRILFFSVVINLILAPLYSQMELRSRAGRAKRAVVAQDVQRMRRFFRGRERYFYIQAVYRQHDFRPLSQLWASGDLLLQIVVFASVFHFLRGLESLQGASFGPLADLSKPAALLGGFNLLPLLMTVINVAAVMAYVEDRARRLQAGALALLFLVLLYASPSGLVLYWTMNNLFSLVRNLLRRQLQDQPPRPYSRQLSELRQQQ